MRNQGNKGQLTFQREKENQNIGKKTLKNRKGEIRKATQRKVGKQPTAPILAKWGS
jgi:hypothetical protein